MHGIPAYDQMLAELEEDARLVHTARPLDLPELARVAAAIAALATPEVPSLVVANSGARLRAEFAAAPVVPNRSMRWAALGTAAAVAAAALLALGGSGGGYALPGLSLLPWSELAPAPAEPPVAPAAATNLQDTAGGSGLGQPGAAIPAAVPSLGALPNGEGGGELPDLSGELSGLLDQFAGQLPDIGELPDMGELPGVGELPGTGELPGLDGLEFGPDEIHFDGPDGSFDVVGGEHPAVHAENESGSVNVDSANGGSVDIDTEGVAIQVRGGEQPSVSLDANGVSVGVSGGDEPAVSIESEDASLHLHGGESPAVDVQAGDISVHLEPGQFPEVEGVDLPEPPELPTAPGETGTPTLPELPATPQLPAPNGSSLPAIPGAR